MPSVAPAAKHRVKQLVNPSEILLFNGVFLNFIIKASFTNAQYFGGFFLIPVICLQGFNDKLSLHILQTFTRTNIDEAVFFNYACLWLSYFRWQIGTDYHITGTQSHCSLDYVFQFPNVSL